MTAKRYVNWIYQGVYYLAAGLIFSAIILRSYLVNQGTPKVGQILALLLIFLVVATLELLLSKRIDGWFNLFYRFASEY